jgi:hypothetical protein
MSEPYRRFQAAYAEGALDSQAAVSGLLDEYREIVLNGRGPSPRTDDGG